MMECTYTSVMSLSACVRTHKVCGLPECPYTPYGWRMTSANERRKTTRRQIGIDDPDWDELADIVGAGNRSEVIRNLVRAFLKRPGVKMPTRAQYDAKKAN